MKLPSRVFLVFCILISSSAFAKPKKAKAIPKVVVKASQASSHVATVSQSHIVTGRDIKQQGAVHVAQMLQGQPGVQLQNLSGDDTNIAVSMRGFGSNAAQNSLIVFNGVPLDNPDISAPNINAIPLLFMSQMNIINASQGVLFGNQAVGGVVNITSTTPTHFENLADISFGSYDQWLYRAYMADALPNGLSFRFFAQKDQSANYREHNNNDNQQIDGQFGLNYATGFIKGFYFFSKQHLLYPGALTQQQLHENRRQAQLTKNFSDDNFDAIQLQQQHWSQTWISTTNVAYRDQSATGQLFGNFNQNQSVWYVSPNVKGLIHNGLLTSGIALQENQYRLNSVLGHSKDSQSLASIYSQYNLPVFAHFTLILGVRGAQQNNQLDNDSHSQTSNNQALVSTLGLQDQITSHWSVDIRRAGSYRFPKADENVITENDHALKTQTGVSYELGVNNQQTRYRLHANLFMLNLNNEIAFDPTKTASQPFGANRNLAPTRRLGLLLWGKYYFTRSFDVFAQYTHIDPRFRSGIHKGKIIPFVAQNTYQLALLYHLDKHWIYFVQGIFTGSMFAAGDDNNIKQRFASYFIVNLNTRYHYHHVYLNFRLNNVFNSHYNSYTSFDPSNQQLYFYPAPGRNFLVSLGYDFA